MPRVVKYHCSLDRDKTLCGRPAATVDYVNTLYWDRLRARNRCKHCLVKRPIQTNNVGRPLPEQKP